MLHIDQSFKCEYSSSKFSSSVFDEAHNVAIFAAMEQFDFFLLLPLVWHSNNMYMPCKRLNIR